MQFVPLTFRVDRDLEIQELEPSQTCGHLILMFQTPHAANNTLVNSLFIGQKKVYAEKCKCEPLRCLKCHRWGHLAAKCGAPYDICSTCALQHHTATCTNPDSPQCVSCKALNGSWVKWVLLLHTDS